LYRFSWSLGVSFPITYGLFVWRIESLCRRPIAESKLPLKPIRCSSANLPRFALKQMHLIFEVNHSSLHGSEEARNSRGVPAEICSLLALSKKR
jgi:hypothetical protein